MLNAFTGTVTRIAKLILLLFLGLFLAQTAVAQPTTPLLTSITPDIGPDHIPVLVTVTGANFALGIRLTLSRPGQGPVPVIEDLVGVQVLSDTLVQAFVPAGLQPAIYRLSVLDEAGNVTDSLPDAYQVVSAAETDDLFANNYDFWIDPAGGPQVGQAVTLGLTVHRRGGQAVLTNVKVAFYRDEPPATPGDVTNLIGEGLIVELAPNSQAAATFTTTVQATGTFTLFALIDPDTLIPEDSEANNLVQRQVTVRPVQPGTTPPPTPGFTINGGALLTTEPDVVLNISPPQRRVPTDAPRAILYVEFVFVQSVGGWAPVKIGPWLPLQVGARNFLWRLQARPGVHYLQAWTADRYGNVSATPARQFINYVPTVSDILTNEGHVYRWPLQVGEGLQVRLTAVSGDPDLYVWAPDGSLVASSQKVEPVDELFFTAAVTGTYQIEVDGAVGGQYQLEILPVLAKAHELEVTAVAFRPKGRTQPYFAPNSEPDDNASLPPAPSSYLYLPVIKRP